MGLLLRLLFLGLTVGSALLTYRLLIQPHPVPTVEDEFWGPKSEQGKKEDVSIKPFHINISSSVIEDLKLRLKRELDSKRLVPPLEGVGFQYGFNSDFLKTVGQHWLTKYDWRVREKLLNKYPHFKTKIGGLDIHFQHIKPKAKNGVPPRPLLVLHGWPGSFVEFQKIIPLLTDTKNYKYNYELVIPSLPGYGFSSAAARRGMSATEIGNIFKRLMNRLGHDKFFVQGGDWGAVIATDIATAYPHSVIAAQSNMCFPKTVIGHIRYFLATLLPGYFMPGDVQKVVPNMLEYAKFTIRESGYFHIQATKPDTVGVALTHSPLGMAAYILEKFSTWTHRPWIERDDGGLLENYTMDELLDNVMIYWVTGSMTTSIRLYAEQMDPAKKHKMERVPTNVPFSCQYLQSEIASFPEFALRDKFTNLQKYSVLPRGGHFGAFELPDVVAENVLSHFENY